MDNNIDIVEQQIHDLDPELLSILLREETTGQNIRWACDDYASLGDGYAAEDQIIPSLITGDNTNVIRPRVLKEKETQTDRTREKAEVFTPSWICNKQNNLVDEAWFGRQDIFNTEIETTWIATDGRIPFPDAPGKSWRDYVMAQRMEITCGEAPYLVSRYDSVTGVPIHTTSRIGLLDRKLRVVGENVHSEQEWIEWTMRALQSVYGYDFQGDNVLLARENILMTVDEYYLERYTKSMPKDLLRQAAIIISWNIWQMNGITYTVPYSEEPILSDQFDWFTDMGGQVELKKEISCLVMDWQAGETVEYEKLVKE